MAAGWLCATVFFSVCWVLARRLPLAIAIFVVIATTSMVLWWPWRLAIIGWVIVPAIAAMMLETSRRWTGHLATWRAHEVPIQAETTDSSSASLNLSYTSKTAIFFAVGSAMIFTASTLLAQEPGSAGLSERPVNVLVPMGADGKQVGDKVYIPGSVFDQLFAPPPQDQLAKVTIQNASYRLDLDDRDAIPEIKAEYRVHIDGTDQIRLPFDSTSVRRVELKQGEENRILKFVRDSDGILLNLPPGQTHELRLTLIPTDSTNGQQRRLELSIPSIASSRLLVDTAREINSVRIAEYAGVMTADPALRRWTADLGPVRKIDIAYNLGSPDASDMGKLLQRRYWVSAGKRQTSVDCQVAPANDVFPGQTIQLEVLHPAMPKIVSPTWQMLRETLLTPSRRLITLVKIADTDEPIELFWTLDSQINDLTSTADSAATAIPEVVAVGSQATANAVFAIEHDPDLQVAQADNSLVQAVEPQEFLQQWRGAGDRGSIVQSFVSKGEFPSLLLLRGKTAFPAVTQQHDLHVTTDHLELRYTAQISAAEMQVRNLTLRMPANLDLLRLRLNGRRMDRAIIHSKKTQQIALGEFDGTTAAVIEAVVTAPGRRNRKISLPVISLWPPTPSRDTYKVTRSAGINVKVTSASVDVVDQTIQREQLVAGRFPLFIWTSDAEGESLPIADIILQSVPQSRSFGCQQLIVLDYDDGRWSTESLIRLDASNTPDYIDLEIPSRWCESLEVAGAAAWTRTPSINSSIELLRIAPGDGQRLLSIRGKLDTSDQGGISVPQVNVLGAGPRTVFASVPQGASGQWKSRGAQEEDLSEVWKDAIEDDQQRQSFRVQKQFNRSMWSVELEPQPDIKTISLAADAQVFLQDSNALVLYRWDLIPGSLRSVVVLSAQSRMRRVQSFFAFHCHSVSFPSRSNCC